MYDDRVLTRIGNWLKPLVAKAAPVSLSVGGLGSLAAAGFTVNVTIGLLATGAAALLLEWRVKEK